MMHSRKNLKKRLYSLFLYTSMVGLFACGHKKSPDPKPLSYIHRPAHPQTFRCVEVIPGSLAQDMDRFILTEVEQWARNRLSIKRQAAHTLMLRVFFQSKRVDPQYTSTWQRFTYNAVETYKTTVMLVCTVDFVLNKKTPQTTFTLTVQDTVDLPQHYSVNQRTAAWQYKIQQWMYNLDVQLAKNLK